MAIEDALVLADELRRRPDMPAAVAAFGARERRTVVARAVAGAGVRDR